MADMVNAPIKVKGIEDLPETLVIQPNWWFRVIDAAREKGDRTLKASGQTMAAYFAGQKGDKGDPGPASTVPGPKGDPGPASTVPGPKGDPGAASTVPGPTGKSAFELAQSTGFSGGLAQWLASLVGPQGPSGVANCRNARVAIGSGLLAPNAVQLLRVTWPTPFLDDLYTVAWSFESASLLGGVRVEVRARNKAYVDLAIVNGLISLTLSAVLLHVTATHDA